MKNISKSQFIKRGTIENRKRLWNFIIEKCVMKKSAWRRWIFSHKKQKIEIQIAAAYLVKQNFTLEIQEKVFNFKDDHQFCDEKDQIICAIEDFK